VRDGGCGGGKGLKASQTTYREDFSGYGQWIPLSVFEEAGLELEKLQMTR